MMAGKTISAYVDDAVADQVTALARRQHRSVGQMTGAALRFYLSLGTEAQDALRTIEDAGTPDERRQAAADVIRILLRHNFRIGRREWREANRHMWKPDMTAEEIDAEADRMIADADEKAKAHLMEAAK
jgi:hypothetical protein